MPLYDILVAWTWRPNHNHCIAIVNALSVCLCLLAGLVNGYVLGCEELKYWICPPCWPGICLCVSSAVRKENDEHCIIAVGISSHLLVYVNPVSWALHIYHPSFIIIHIFVAWFFLERSMYGKFLGMGWDPQTVVVSNSWTYAFLGQVLPPVIH